MVQCQVISKGRQNVSAPFKEIWVQRRQDVMKCNKITSRPHCHLDALVAWPRGAAAYEKVWLVFVIFLLVIWVCQWPPVDHSRVLGLEGFAVLAVDVVPRVLPCVERLDTDDNG